MSKRFRTGRVKVDFAVIERFAGLEAASAILPANDGTWTLSRKSAIHRCKNGSFTVCLIWTSGSLSMSSVIRGVRLERS